MIRSLFLLFALLPVLTNQLHAAEPVYPDLRDKLSNIAINRHPAADRGMTRGIRIVDDRMLKPAALQAP